MNTREAIDFYYHRMEFFLRLLDHGLSNICLIRQFINGLFSPQLKTYVKDFFSCQLVVAYQWANL